MTYTVIRSARHFKHWAEKEFGPNWYKEQQVIKTYGLEQLKRLYPSLF